MELSEEVKQVESHLSWIKKSLPADVKLDDPISVTDYVASRLEIVLNSKQKGEEVDGDDDVVVGVGSAGDQSKSTCCEQQPLWVDHVSKRLGIAAMTLYTGDFDSVSQQLVEVRHVLEKLTGEHKERLFDVGEYSVEALEWCIRKMQEQQEMTTENTTDKMKTLLQNKWSSFQSNQKICAVLKFFKVSLWRGLSNLSDIEKNAKYLEVTKEVIRMDPGYFMWYHYSMIGMKRLRRCPIERFNDFIPEGPSPEDEHWCKMEMNLAPNIFITNYDYANMLRGKLDISKGPRGKKDREIAQESIFYLNKALNLSVEAGFKYWTVRIQSEKADLLNRWGDTKARVDEGLKLMYSLLKSYPNNQYFFRALARFYQHGAKTSDNVDEHYRRDFEKSEEYYKKCIEKYYRSSNKNKIYFNSVRDYLKLAPFLPNSPALSIQEIFKKLTEVVESFEMQLDKSAMPGMSFRLIKALIWRASLQICDLGENTNNKRAACEELILVMKRFPDVKVRTLLNAFRNPPFAKRGSNHGERLWKLEDSLEIIKNEGPENVEDYERLKLIELLQNKISLGKRVLPNIGVRNSETARQFAESPNGRNDNPRRNVIAGPFHSRQFRREPQSEADMDQCWRRK